MSNKSAVFTLPDDCCPECGAAMVMRTGKNGPFAGCSRYPECHYIRRSRPASESPIIKVFTGMACPLCDGEKALRQGRYGMFITCTHYPECQYTESIDQAETTEVKCPQCHEGNLIQRRSRYGKTFYSCSTYPKCSFAVNHQPINGECPTCHYPLLIEKRTPQGTKLFCANKQCAVAVPVSEEKNE